MPLLFVLLSSYYIVVIDPAHGGRRTHPSSIYGSSFEFLSERFTTSYHEGSKEKGLWEREISYRISRWVKRYLDLTQTKWGRRWWYKRLKRYGRPGRITRPIKSYLLRKTSFHDTYAKYHLDPNAPYRLYDYQNILTGKRELGLISKMNSYKPHLIISIHLTGGRGPRYGGLASVITPSYYIMRYGFLYVKEEDPKEREKIRKKWESTPWKNWLIFDKKEKRDHFSAFLKDAWIYFIGIGCDRTGLNPDFSYIRGYRYNAITWRYQDPPGWEKEALEHEEDTPYALHLKDFAPTNAFFRREMGLPERWRREKGEEGFGGDNFYASQEILRYIRLLLYSRAKIPLKKLPSIREPFISIWGAPTFTNAIYAYVEIGFIDNPYDYSRILRYPYLYAEAIATGIYSLFYGIKISSRYQKKDFPKGKKIPFYRYENYRGKNYFEEVWLEEERSSSHEGSS